MKRISFKGSAAFAAASVIAISAAAPFNAVGAEEEIQTIVTDYGDLWNGTISARAGETVKWYVNVPEGTTPKGCGATIKIPDLGWGTDTHNKEEGHLTLTEGENFVYEFTPDKTGDILFTCWMGSTCHYNYIHITDDGSYSLQKPGDPGNISALRDGENVAVSFEAPANPDNVTIKGYKVTALADDGTRVRASGTESPITLEGVDKSKNYTISIVTLSNAGKSEGAGSYVLEADADSAPETTTVNEEAATTVSTIVTQTSQRSSETASSTTKKQDSNNSPKTGVPLPAGAAALLISSLGIALLSRKKSDTE